MTKDGLQKPNYYGSLTQAATCRVGNYKGEEIHVPFSSLLPMVNPNDIVLGGWDISGVLKRRAGRPGGQGCSLQLGWAASKAEFGGRAGGLDGCVA